MQIIVSYLNIQDSAATPNNTFQASDSIDLGNNDGWTFVSIPTNLATQRLAEAGAVQIAVASTNPAGSVSRLGGAGAIEANIIDYKTQYDAPVSGLTAKGRWINKAKGYI